MTEFITLTCPTCGGKLQVAENTKRFCCLHCGNEHLLKRGENVLSVTPVIEGIMKVQNGVDRTASELALTSNIKVFTYPTVPAYRCF